MTLAKQLKKMGHTVEGFSPELGIIAEDMENAGIPCFSEISTSGIKPFSIILEPERKYDYDVIISNHNHIVDFLRLQFPTTPIISTIHGILHFDGKTKAPEHPALDAGVNQFVSVSEEVQEKLQKDYSIDSYLIRNFFDVNKFKAKRKINDKPKQFLLNTNYALKDDPEVRLIKEVATHYGAKLTAVGQNFTQTNDLSKAIEDADIVVGMGRSVLEGVCAGRLGIVHGRWGTGGVICKNNVEELRRFNFSGRNSDGRMMTKDELIAEIDKYYNPATIDWGMQYIRTEHNAALAAEQYVKLAEELLGMNINKDNRRVVKFRIRDNG